MPDSSNESESKYGRTIYSSKPQSQLEAEAGEKLFKISDGVYINQVTKDFIESEETPDITNDVLHNFDSIFLKKQDYLATTWHPSKLILIAVYKKDTRVNLEVATISNGKYKIESNAVLPSMPYDVIKIAHHPNLPLVSICTPHSILVWDYEHSREIFLQNLPDGKVTNVGFYPSQNLVWANWIGEDKNPAAHQWLVIDYNTKTKDVYDVEYEDVYSRGSTLHPSGLLIGVLYNDHNNGYYIHTSTPKLGHLYYYSEPSPSRREYEAYSPDFSITGKYFAYIANPYMSMRKNYSKVVIYDIKTAKLQAEFYTGSTNFDARQLQFAHGSKYVTLFDVQSSIVSMLDCSNGQLIGRHEFDTQVVSLSSHQRYGYYSISCLDGLYILIDKTDLNVYRTDTKRGNESIAKSFIKKNSKYRLKVGNLYN